MNKEEFIKGMSLLSIAYNKNFTKEELEVWYQMLGKNSKREFSIAIQRLIKTEEYMPSIAKINKTIAELKLGDVPSAEDEWNRVIKSVQMYGSYQQEKAMEYLGQRTAYIVSLVGYQRICMATPEEQIWNKKEFIDKYNALKDKDIFDIQTKQIGISQVQLLENEKGS